MPGPLHLGSPSTLAVGHVDLNDQEDKFRVPASFRKPPTNEGDASHFADSALSHGLRASLPGSSADHGGDPRMSSLQDFVGKLSKVAGIKGYILVGRDGQILSQTMRLPDRFSAMAVICGSAAESVVTTAGVPRFRCLVIARGKKEKFLVFPAMQFFLLVIERPDIYTPDLLKEIEDVIRTSIPF